MKTTIAHKVMKNSPKVTKRVSSTLDFLILFDHAKSMEETMNTYAYCKNNPIMNIDPDGEFWNFIVHIVSAFAMAYGTSAGLQWIENRFDFSKIDWVAANRAGSFAAMSYAFSGFGTENLLGDAWYEEMIEYGISDGISSMASGGDFYEGFNSGMKDYLMRRTWDGMSFDLDDSDYFFQFDELKNLEMPGDWAGLLVASPNVLGIFEHWHVITRDGRDYGYNGYEFLGRNYGSAADSSVDTSKSKYRIVNILNSENYENFNPGRLGYQLPWNNCVHAAKSQTRKKLITGDIKMKKIIFFIRLVLIFLILLSFSYSKEQVQDDEHYKKNKGLISLDYFLDNPVGSFVGQTGICYWMSEYPILIGIGSVYATTMSRGIKDDLFLYSCTIYNILIAKTGNRNEVFFTNLGLFVLWSLLPDSLNKTNNISILPNIYPNSDKTTLAWNYQF